MRLIDADELYKRTAEWEEQAQDEVNKNKGCRTVEEWDKYKEWLIILNERSSFKYDIADAPTIEPKHGRWLIGVGENGEPIGTYCSECGWSWERNIAAIQLIKVLSRIETPRCPYCGAKMDDTPTEKVDTPTECTNRPTGGVEE